jgi:hypothetical protein
VAIRYAPTHAKTDGPRDCFIHRRRACGAKERPASDEHVGLRAAADDEHDARLPRRALRFLPRRQQGDRLGLRERRQEREEGRARDDRHGAQAEQGAVRRAHRGPQTPPPFPTAKPARPELPPLADIVKKYAAAVGDAAKWESRTEAGTREDSSGKSAPITIQETADKWHVVGETPAGKMDQVVVGTSGWARGEKGLQTLKPADVARFHDLAAAYVPTAPGAIPSEARVVAKEKVGEHEAYVVVARAGGTRQRFYFDTTTGLLVRRVIVTDSPIGPIPQQTDFDDWRDAGGAKYPFYVRASFVDPWNSTTRKYSEVKLGAIDPAGFAEPK